ncbi:MAG: prolyl oligopeptidase family serine peptidase [Bifidobacteriaceae bacterium]|nr:prolyl oligopeptidase family serine peptidase [Bifidobacteriaceae bacterium]
MTLAESKESIEAISGVSTPWAFRGSVAFSGGSAAFFDSLHGSAVAERRADSQCVKAFWIPGWWIVGAERQNHEVNLVVQRLSRFKRVRMPVECADSYLDVEDGTRFTLNWIESVDGRYVPVSRFETMKPTRTRALVTVHGGFGISLRPFSGAPGKVHMSDIVFAHVRGGGELGPGWAGSGRGENKGLALDDLRCVLRYERRRGEVHLIGASHGGWLALLAAMHDPATVGSICVTSPIIDLKGYLASDLGQKHRSEFPRTAIESMDPTSMLARYEFDHLPRLMVIAGRDDQIVQGQRYEEFARAWRRSGGTCELAWHGGGHYAPMAEELAIIMDLQGKFFS